MPQRWPVLAVFTLILATLVAPLSTMPAHAELIGLPPSVQVLPKPLVLIFDLGEQAIPVSSGNLLYLVTSNSVHVVMEGSQHRYPLAGPATAIDSYAGVLAVGTKSGEVLVVNGSKLLAVYVQALQPVEGVWILQGGYVAVLYAPSGAVPRRLVVYRIGESGWYEVSPITSRMVLKQLVYRVEGAIASKTFSGEPGDTIAFIARPATYRPIIMRLLTRTVNGSIAPLANAKTAIVVPEYGYYEERTSNPEGFVSLKAPVPAKRARIYIWLGGGICRVLELTALSATSEALAMGDVLVDTLGYTTCPSPEKVQGASIVFLSPDLSIKGVLRIKAVKPKLLALYQTTDYYLLVLSSGNYIVLVRVTPDLSVYEEYRYLLPGTPLVVKASPDGRYLYVGSAEGNVYVIDLARFKLLWGFHVSQSPVTAIDANIVAGERVVAVTTGEGLLTLLKHDKDGLHLLSPRSPDEGIVLGTSTWIQLDAASHAVLASTSKGYLVVYGVDELAKRGELVRLAERILQPMTIRVAGPRGEKVPVKVEVFHDGELLFNATSENDTIIVPYVLPELEYLVRVTPLVDWLLPVEKSIKGSGLVEITLPYRLYNVGITLLDELGYIASKLHLEIISDGRVVAEYTVEPRKGSWSTMLKLPYGVHEIVVEDSSTPPLYKPMRMTVNVTGEGLVVPIRLERIARTLTILLRDPLGGGPIDPLELLVVQNNTILYKGVVKPGQSSVTITVPGAGSAELIVRDVPPKGEWPAYENMSTTIALRDGARVEVRLKPRLIPLNLTIIDPSGELIQPIQVYLDGKLVAEVANRTNASIVLNVSKGIHSVRIIGVPSEDTPVRIYYEIARINVSKPSKLVINITRRYAPVKVVIVDAYSGRGPITRLLLASGEYRVEFKPSPRAIHAIVYVSTENPVINVTDGNIYNSVSVRVNLTVRRVAIRLFRNLVAVGVTVVDEGGNPLKGAYIEVEGLEFPFYLSTVTSPTGTATIAVPFGKYRVCAWSRLHTRACTYIDTSASTSYRLTLYPNLAGVVARNIPLIMVAFIVSGLALIVYAKRESIYRWVLGAEEEIF